VCFWVCVGCCGGRLKEKKTATRAVDFR